MTTATAPLQTPHSTEIEIELLGGLMLDSGALKLVPDLQADHFYHHTHQLIFTAIRDLAAQSKPTSMNFVVDYLNEKNWLGTVGGKSAIARIASLSMSSVFTNAHAKEIQEKWQRRELIRQGEELIRAGTGFAPINDAPKVTKSTRAARATLSYEQVVQRMEAMLNEHEEDPGRLEYEFWMLKQEAGIPVSELKKIHLARKEVVKPCEWVDALELINSSPEKFDWLIAGLLPMSTTALLYAEGGVGKTLLAYNIIKAVACGESWNGFPTKAGKVLLMQTDEPSVVTAQNMRIAGFVESLPPGQLMVNVQWQFSQMKKLRESIKQHGPALVVIDSLTSSNRYTSSEEKDVEYGRCLYELRDIAMEFGCSVLVLHHENKMGGIRGSTSLKANVSEVWRFKKSTQLSPLHRILEVEKSRSGCSGSYQMLLDPDNYSWQHQGDFDPSQHGDDAKPAALPLKARLLNFLEERPGIPFEPEELVADFGASKEAIRKTLERLWRSGLIDFESRIKSAGTGTRKYKVYLVKEVVRSSESPSSKDSSSGQSQQVAQDNIPPSVAQDPPCPQPKPAPSKDSIAQDKTTTGHPPVNNENNEIQQLALDTRTKTPLDKKNSVQPKEAIAVPEVGQKVTINTGTRKGREATVLAVYQEDGAIFCQVQLDGGFGKAQDFHYRVEFLLWQQK